MSRFEKWSNIELKVLYYELLSKKQKSSDEIEMLDMVKEELKRRGVTID